MKKFLVFLLSVCMGVSLCTANMVGVLAKGVIDETIVNDFAIGNQINQVQYLGLWHTDENYPDLFYNGDDHWASPVEGSNQFETTAMEIIFYGDGIALYGNKEPMAGIQSVYIDGEKITDVDTYKAEKEYGACLFDSRDHLTLSNDKHVLRYQGSGTKNDASIGYNLQFDYAKVFAQTEGVLQYAQFDQDMVTLKEGESVQLLPTLFPKQAAVQLEWVSDADTIASVDTNGTVHALAEGETNIHVKVVELGITLHYHLRVEKDVEIVYTDVNDDQVGDDMFQFSYEGGWVHEGGFPDRFYGGDEHWITKAQFKETLPSFHFRFIGNKVELYGHKCFEGAMADVYLDGTFVGTIDYYLANRQEQQLLYASEELVEDEHILTVKLNGQHNQNGGSNLEAAIDFARFYHTDREFYPTSIVLDKTSIVLEEGMQYVPTYRILPSYATVVPPVVWRSEDETIATVDASSGAITAQKAGTTTIYAQLEGMQIETGLQVEVKQVQEEFSAIVQDNNLHTYPDHYLEYIESLYDSDTSQQHSFKASAWRNDVVTSRIDLFTRGKGYQDVVLESSDFVSGQHTIAKDQIAFTYMDSAIAHTNEQAIMDVITNRNKQDLEKQSLYSAWVSIAIPTDAKAGTYQGTLKIKTTEETLASFTYEIEVLDLVQPQDLSQLELWMYPYSSNRYYSQKTTSEYFGDRVEDLYAIHLDDAYQAGLESQLEQYKKLGGDAITVTIVEDPWNSQTPDPYPSMIKWTKKADGTFAFDYTDFDKWVNLNLKHGIDGQIKSFSMSCWGNRVTYYDEAIGKVVSQSLTTGSSEWETIWRSFLNDYIRHLDEKGWFSMTYMSMDERPLQEIVPVLDLIESVKNKDGESLKTSLAVFNYETESIFDRIDDLSLAYQMGSEKVLRIAEERRQKGLLTTMYTCGAQNSAMLNQPGESAYSIYHAYKYGSDGFLRWALDAFNEDPLTTSAHRLFAAGDLYLIYPDEKTSTTMRAQSTPRYEKLAEGIRDVDKLRYLEEQYPFLQDKIQALKQSIGQNDMCTEVVRLKEEIIALSKEALYGPIEPSVSIREKDVVLQVGESKQLTLSYTPSDLLKDLKTVAQINDFDADIAYFGPRWNTDEGYNDLFLNGDDHWCAPKDGEAMKQYGYEFYFYGDMFSIVGNRENLAGIADIYIDGEYVASMDPYQQTTARFQKIYTSDRLTLKTHHVKVVGSGKKQEASMGYNMQVDYIETYVHDALRWESDDPSIVEVSADGVVTGMAAGTSKITVTIGDYQDTILVTVKEDAKADDPQVEETGSKNQKTGYANTVNTGQNHAESLWYMGLITGACILLLLQWQKAKGKNRM